MNRVVTVEQLGDAISQEYDEYYKKVRKEQRKILREEAELARSMVEVRTPITDRNGKHLKHGWEVDDREVNGELIMTIHNTTKPGVVHLVELGTIRAKKVTPMLEPTFNIIEPKLIKRLRDINV